MFLLHPSATSKSLPTYIELAFEPIMEPQFFFGLTALLYGENFLFCQSVSFLTESVCEGKV